MAEENQTPSISAEDAVRMLAESNSKKDSRILELEDQLKEKDAEIADLKRRLGEKPTVIAENPDKNLVLFDDPDWKAVDDYLEKQEEIINEEIKEMESYWSGRRIDCESICRRHDEKVSELWYVKDLLRRHRNGM